jgi:hypothetical protein
MPIVPRIREAINCVSTPFWHVESSGSLRLTIALLVVELGTSENVANF